MTTEPKSPDERKRLLASATSRMVSSGWRVESQTEYQAIIVKGHRPNHLLHLFLTIFTAGLWGLVWIAVAATGGERRMTITVDGYGTVRIA